MASFRQRAEKWQARIKRIGYPAETKSFDTYDEAVKWARGVEVDIDRGTHINHSQINNLTLGEIIGRYIDEVCPSKKACKEDVIRLHAIKRRKIASYTMTTLSHTVIAQFRDQRLRQVSAGTVIRELSYLSSIINHARREWGVTITNPCNLVKRPPIPQGRDRILEPDEERRLLKESEPTGRRNVWLHAVIVIAIATAMRRGEILDLRWDRIDLQKRIAYLPVTKNGSSRTVPLSSVAVETLSALRSHGADGQVFKVTACALHVAFRKACRRADLTDLHFHDLRHTAATRMAKKLPNLIELAAVTGHKDVRMLARYYHPKAEDLALKLG
jgi:integrase